MDKPAKSADPVPMPKLLYPNFQSEVPVDQLGIKILYEEANAEVE